ncbi:hypothetical protein LX15_003421 [Streptoalloteichus tenebrarius]|uniref:Uncharacterized protein n=1 Tax=Streptoalloteichus tenebrarius (strain ATCC 17920 / DSM 40477 / JCM 4838 / CBS 697.72 / NBRC 16177 / NCIMB 11028 / NRRL B-12390 / A12253. 1 / ISP 5477) TaxID=1933 RepID=A0ABT1HWB3_STRSD|nr:hypothetical protein [Streptoalloteichus tenebrarius]MCP2259715.1 hypothetical protein [Streptoalloteichus tenebrarius]BFF00693.1 hypothetical protein GCM10020241_23680 [Streptoalloteichus tenebrarius]
MRIRRQHRSFAAGEDRSGVDFDEGGLAAAQEPMGAKPPQDTVKAVPRMVSGCDSEGRDLDTAMDVLATFSFVDRANAWR